MTLAQDHGTDGYFPYVALVAPLAVAVTDVIKHHTEKVACDLGHPALLLLFFFFYE